MASDNSGFAGKSAMQGGTGFGLGRTPVPPSQPPRAGDTNRPGIERPPLPQSAEYGTATSPRPSEAEHRTLIVGREIGLSGEITSCDRLVVEGSVQANLANCRYIDIAESGLYKGSASIDDAEIRGRFEGTLIARKRLHIRATGKVAGTVSYAQIEIEAGGQLAGEIKVMSADGAGGAAVASAAPQAAASAPALGLGGNQGNMPRNAGAPAPAGGAPHRVTR
jgi:cytoskeletal protein CcmA (bactofilin family)